MSLDLINWWPAAKVTDKPVRQLDSKKIAHNGMEQILHFYKHHQQQSESRFPYLLSNSAFPMTFNCERQFLFSQKEEMGKVIVPVH